MITAILPDRAAGLPSARSFHCPFVWLVRLARTGAFILCLLGCVAAQAADPSKVLRYAFRVAETNFDPAQTSDIYSNTVIEGIFDPLLAYDYLARPAKLIPNTAQSLPEISDNGTTYTIRVKPGIYFQDDPVFKGKPRELTAADYAYSIRRHFDPRWRSPQQYRVENRIAGAKQSVAEAIKANYYDYDKPLPGLEVVDRYTLRMRLNQPDYTFIYQLAFSAFSAVAWEVVEAYGDNIGAHPVGTGPYRLKDWRRSSRILLEANPGYRAEYFAAEPAPGDENGHMILAAMKGKQLPQVGRVEIYIIEESQPRWLAFLNEEHDLIERLPEEFINLAAPEGKLSGNLVRRGVKLDRVLASDLYYTYFAMEDAVVGGYSADKVALRRAISLGYNDDEEIVVVRKNQAIRAQGPIGPGVAGYDANFRTAAAEYNPAKAKALLDMYGYIDRDGGQDTPRLARAHGDLPGDAKACHRLCAIPVRRPSLPDQSGPSLVDRLPDAQLHAQQLEVSGYRLGQTRPGKIASSQAFECGPTIA
jgi:ABC-type transport system substrate-binding protein